MSAMTVYTQQHLQRLRPNVLATSNGEGPDLGAVLAKAQKRALGGGLAGAAAMGINVGTLMWLRTTVNYQYRYGGTMRGALSHLYKDGGIPRFYRGLAPALLQGPLSRFGDTAANAGVMEIFNAYDETRDLSTLVKTSGASAVAALWRIFLMPIDTLKTTMQVQGKDGLAKLKVKVAKGGPTVMYSGALAACSATFMGHYPWFATYNYLGEALPKVKPEDGVMAKLGRAAVQGFCASFVSDTISNSIRVMKVYRQANEVEISYTQALKAVYKADGLQGIFFRGLGTKIFSNGMQGVLFSILWKTIDDKFFKDKK